MTAQAKKRTEMKVVRKTLTLNKKKTGYPKIKKTRSQFKRMLNRLNKNGKPEFREAFPENIAQTKKDIAVLRAAYLRGSFNYWPQNMDLEQFKIAILDRVGHYDNAIMVYDFNALAGGDYAPVGLIVEFNDGWELTPHVEWFPWATNKNILRSAVNYMKSKTNDKNVGVLVVECLESAKNFYNHVCEYGVLYPVARIKHGWPNGDKFIFSLSCAKAFED